MAFHTDVQDAVAELVLDNPPVNALDSAGWFEYARLIGELGSRTDVNCLLIRAEGRGFQAGVDVKELAADGSKIVGLGWTGCKGQAFLWEEGVGMKEFEWVGNQRNRASAISADGTVAVGFAQGNFSRTPASWSVSDLVGTYGYKTCSIDQNIGSLQQWISKESIGIQIFFA